jgi:predicted Ser/Thr protein kinase
MIVAMNTPRGQFLLGMLKAAPSLGAMPSDRLVDWYTAHANSGEELIATLVRTGVMQPTAVRTLDLIQRGFLSSPDPSLIFTPQGFSVLQDHAASPPEVVAQSVTPKRVAETINTLPTARKPQAAPSKVTSQDETKRMDVQASSYRPAKPAEAIKTYTPPRQEAPVTTNSDGSKSLPKVGDLLGKCLLTAPLGKGGHGAVFTALHQTLNIPVAVKVLFADGRRADESIRRQLRHEAQVLARLNHPNVTRILDFDDGEIPYVVMEYVEGPSLADLIAQTGGLRVERAIEIFRHCVRGLQAAWAHGIVHRDIKPGNILLTKNGEAKLADLGLALTNSNTVAKPVSANTEPVGTCAYMAPEQARTADEVDFRADIYSLGATFYHTVTGRLPFQARSPRELLMKHLTEQVVPPHILDPLQVDIGTSNLIVRMMAKQPHDRFDSYEELLTAMKAVPNATGVDTAKFVTNHEDTDMTQPPPPPTLKASGLWNRLFTQRKPPTE